MLLFGYQFSTAEIVVLVGISGWLFSALAYALPVPTATSSPWYVFTYKLVHFAAANLERFRTGRKTDSPK